MQDVIVTVNVGSHEDLCLLQTGGVRLALVVKGLRIAKYNNSCYFLVVLVKVSR